MINSTLIQRLAVVFIALLSINISYADEFVNLLTSSTDTVYFSDFETNDGGLMDSTSTPGDWRREWDWANPSQINPPEGYYCWGTGMYGNELIEDYEDLYLKTPMIKGKKARITFDSYFDDYSDDRAHVQFRTTLDGWEDLHEFTEDHGWTNYTYETDEMTSDSIQFRFYLDKNHGNNNAYGWYIDNLIIEVYQTSIMHEQHPDTYNPYGPYQIIAELSDSVSWLGNLHIVYSIDDESNVDEDMSQDGSGWTFSFDGQTAGTEISYYFYALDSDANSHYLKRSQNENFSFSILEFEGGYGFNLYQPANFSEDVDIYVLMKWNDLGDPFSKYTIQYGPDVDFNPGTYVEKSGLADTEIYNPVDFIKNAIYYWRVFAVNAISGDTVWANNGEQWVFEIIPPEMPSVLSGAIPIPANRTIIPENNPYYIQGDASNFEGDTLTVRPGVICEFTPGSSFDLFGHIVAEGTEIDRIIFRGEDENSWDGISLNQSTPLLNLTSNFDYISGPKFTYCDFDKGFLNDNGYTGVYIEDCNFTETNGINRIAWGYVNRSNFINGNGNGLEISSLEDNWLTVNSVKIDRSEFISNNGSGLYFDYIDSIFVNQSTSNFNSNNGARSTTCHYMKVDSSIFVENNWKGINTVGGNTVKINLCTMSENDEDGFRETSTSDTVLFTNNMISDNGGFGFIGGSFNYKLIDGNTFYSNQTGYYGVGLHTMTDNQFTENGPSGSVFIEAQGSGGHYIGGNNILFNFNSVTGYYSTGLNLNQGHNAVVENNIISNNEKNCSENFWNNDHGASLAALNVTGNDNLIINNIITDNTTEINTSMNWNWGNSNNDWNLNTSKNHGAGISIIGSNNTLQYNNISNNIAHASVSYSNSTVFLSGGGIYAWGDSLLIRGNTIQNNTIGADNYQNNWNSYAAAYGAGIYIEGYFMGGSGAFDYSRYLYALIDSNSVNNNSIIDNENRNFYSKGAGIYVKTHSNTVDFTAHVDITNNEINNNSFVEENEEGDIYQEGVGVYTIDNGNRGRFANNTVVGNTSEYGHGGGVFASVNIDSSTISQNISQYGGGIYFQDIDGLNSYKVDYSTITLNTAREDYGAIYNPTEVTRSIVVGNKVIDNGEFDESAIGGIGAPSTAQSLTDLHYSNLYDNTGYDLKLFSSNLTSVDAEFTWWNSRSDQILIKDEIWDGFDDPGNLGIVDYQPFLTFASDQTPGQIQEYLGIELYTDNTYQMLLGENVDLDQRFFIEMEVVDGNENSVDMSAVRIENLRNGDFIGPVVVETNLNTGIFRGSAVTSDTTNFVFDSLRVIQGDTIRISPYNYPDIHTILIVDTTAVEYLQGDANSDDAVDVIDVMNIIYYILNITDEINFYAADVNSDSYINVIDAIGVINIIMGDLLQKEIPITYLTVNLPKVQTVDDEEIIIPIDISWAGGSIGGVEITLASEDLEIIDIYTEVDEADIFYNDVEENKTKCLIVSLDDNIIDAENSFQVFVSVQLEDEQGTLLVTNILISDPYGNAVETVLSNDETEILVLPDKFNLGYNYPNPFNPNTRVRIELPIPVVADVVIYNIRGQAVRDIISSTELTGGHHTIIWDGKDNTGKDVTSGIYFLKFISKEYSVSRKMTVLR